MSPALARPASFDAGAAERRALIAKIHVAKKQMQLTDDDYRAMLLRTTGEMSAADCTVAGLRAMVEEMKAKGFQAKPRAGASTPRPADHPAARKARALWISLHQLGAIDNPSEQALEAFARRQLKVDRMQWANQALMYKLVEALKAIAKRHGWRQVMEGVTGAAALRALKVRLCEAILVKLKAAGLAGSDWDLETAAFRLLGHSGERSQIYWELGEIDVVAQGFGRKLRGEG